MLVLAEFVSGFPLTYFASCWSLVREMLSLVSPVSEPVSFVSFYCNFFCFFTNFFFFLSYFPYSFPSFFTCLISLISFVVLFWYEETLESCWPVIGSGIIGCGNLLSSRSNVRDCEFIYYMRFNSVASCWARSKAFLAFLSASSFSYLFALWVYLM